MATIRVTCPTCKQELELEAQYAGQEVECGSCLQVFVAKDPSPQGPAPKKPYKAIRDSKDDDDNDDDDDDRPRRKKRRRRRASNDYGDYDDEYDDRPAEASGGSSTAATFALVLGILSVVTGCCWCIGLPMSIGGIVCGLVGMKNPNGKGLAVAGLVLGIIGLLLSGGIMVMGFAGNGGAFGPMQQQFGR